MPDWPASDRSPITIYDAAVLAEPNLASYYKFADNFGTKTAVSVRDAKGSVHGQAAGSTTVGLGAAQGLGVYFPGASNSADNLAFGDNFDQTGTAAFSFEFLLRRDGGVIGNGTQCYVFGKEDGLAAGTAYDSYMSNESLSFRRMDSAGGSDVVTSPIATFTPGTRRHVVITYDAANLRMYIDGTEVTGSPVASTRLVQNVTTAFRLGAVAANVQGFQGMFGRFAVYSAALSAAAIATHAALAADLP